MSYILEALRKSEKQRREIEDEPLLRLTASLPPRRPSRWKMSALVLSAATNVAILAYLFGPLPLPTDQGDAAGGSPPDQAVRTPAAAGTPVVVQAPLAKPPGVEEAPRRAETRPPEEPQATNRLDRIPSEPPSMASKAGDHRPASPAIQPPRAARESPRQRAVPTPKTKPPEAAEFEEEDEAPRQAAHYAPKLPLSDRAPPAEPPASDPDGLPRPKINVYAYTARVDGDRFVIIRNQRYHEGDRIEEGAIVRRIEEHAMTLEFAGRTYKIARP